MASPEDGLYIVRRKIEKQRRTFSFACFPTHAANSWFLLHETREKLLQATGYIIHVWPATVCFFIKHVQVCHALCDAFDVNSICQLIFYWKCFGIKNANFSPKYDKKQVFKSSSQRLDIVKIKNRSTLRALGAEFQCSLKEL